ncbi:MAG TPA: sugar ABC transporter permease [Mycobacteriales bacterium]|nr:sugar ABC transporter permease [Mycobacteriales bacterium]
MAAAHRIAVRISATPAERRDPVRGGGRPVPGSPSRRGRSPARAVIAARDALPFIALKGVVFGLFILAPFVYTFYLTFQSGSLLSGLHYAGLENYREIFRDTLFWTTLRNTGFFMVVLIPSTIVVTLLLGLLLSSQARGMGIYRTLIYLPSLLSVVATGVVWKVMIDPGTGPLDRLLHGLFGVRVPWLTSGTFTILFLCIVSLWASAGFYSLIFMSGFNEIPDELLEAARIDGANALQVLWLIKLPMIRPVMQLVLVLVTVNAVQVFDLVYVLTQGGPGTSTYTAMWYVYQNAFNGGSVAYAATMSVILLIITAAIAVAFVARRGKGGVADRV